MNTTKQAERDRVIQKLSTVTVARLRQAALVEREQVELYRLTAEQDELIRRLEQLDGDG
jgi:hypothetical protein